MPQIQIQNESNDHKYFTVTPQLVWALSRDTYDYTLWSTIKMIAGDTGECFVTRENLATLAMMSAGKVSDSREHLIEAGLLEGKQKPVSSGQWVWHLKIPDLWEENLRWRKTLGDKLSDRIQLKLDQKASRHTVTALSDRSKPSLYDGKPSPGDAKESPVKENHKEEEEALDSLGSVGETPEEEPESSEPVRVDLDDDGEFVPTKDYDKNNPFFRLVMNNVLGHPKNLQGHERKDWMDIQRRAVEDLEFKAWVIWQSQNNAKGKRLKVLMEFVNNELDFGDWTRNAFKAASPENIAGAKRGARGGTNKPVNDAALRVEEESLPHESEMTREQLRALLK